MLFDNTITVAMMDPDELSLHQVVYLFPELNEREFDKLVNSIQAQGQLDPVWITRNNEIVDGRHRWRACKKLQRPVMCRRLEKAEVTTTIIDHVIAQNVSRRHLDPGQRAIIAATLENKWREAMRRQELNSPPDGAGNDFPWETFEDLLVKMNTNYSAIRRAHRIKNLMIPEMVKCVEDGVLSINAVTEAIDIDPRWSPVQQRNIVNSQNPKQALKNAVKTRSRHKWRCNEKAIDMLRKLLAIQRQCYKRISKLHITRWNVEPLLRAISESRKELDRIESLLEAMVKSDDELTAKRQKETWGK